MKKLTHTDSKGKASMVDISSKNDQIRTAIASGCISLQNETIELIKESKVKKGDVLTIAEIAGIMGGKKTSELIPLCHNLNISKIDVKAYIVDNGIEIKSFAKCLGKTGIEMEALTAVSIALLTIYDMCKAVDKQMVIGEIKLIEKVKEDIETNIE